MDPVAAYHDPPAKVLIFDEHAAVMAEELSAFLAGWQGLTPGDYTPAYLQTAAAVMVDRVRLRGVLSAMCSAWSPACWASGE